MSIDLSRTARLAIVIYLAFASFFVRADLQGDIFSASISANKAMATDTIADEAKADEAKADEAKADEAKADEVIADEVIADEEVVDDGYQRVLVAEPFIEFHTGPGRGYPVFHIVEKNQQIIIIKKRTQWYKVKSPRGKLGWVHEKALIKTLDLAGQSYQAEQIEQQSFVDRQFEMGVLAGEFGGAKSMTLHAGWSWTPNLIAEIAFSQALGNASEIQFLNVNLMHQPFPEWRFSPYFKLGGGIIQTLPNATLVFAEDRKDDMIHAGAGIRVYISQQFFLRAEYNSHTILTSRNDNDEVEEWKIGFSVFF